MKRIERLEWFVIAVLLIDIFNVGSCLLERFFNEYRKQRSRTNMYFQTNR